MGGSLVASYWVLYLLSVGCCTQPCSIRIIMAIALYYVAGSAPCRLVLLVAAALNIQLDLHTMDLRAGDQLKPEFLKLNPQHTVPTIVDEDFSLWESRAIARYLVAKQGGSSLYPEDPKTRALIDQRLDFDIGSLYASLSQYYGPLFAGRKPEEAQLEKLRQKLSFFNTFLEGQKYAVGSQLTLADLSLVSTVSTIDAMDVDLTGYPNIVRWYDLVKSTAPGYEEANQKGADEFKKIIAMVKAKTEL